MANSLGSVSPERRQLMRLMQQINFGRIQSLEIIDGQPVLSPRPHIIREIKFGAENGPRPELRSRDFLLKAQVVELFACFDELQNGVVDVLEVKHGLPFRMLVGDLSA